MQNSVEAEAAWSERNEVWKNARRNQIEQHTKIFVNERRIRWARRKKKAAANNFHGERKFGFN